MVILVMCGFYCIALIEYMITGKTALSCTNLFSPNYYKNHEKIIYKYFKDQNGLDFNLTQIDETRNHLSDEIKQ